MIVEIGTGLQCWPCFVFERHEWQMMPVCEPACMVALLSSPCELSLSTDFG